MHTMAQGIRDPGEKHPSSGVTGVVVSQQDPVVLMKAYIPLSGFAKVPYSIRHMRGTMWIVEAWHLAIVGGTPTPISYRSSSHSSTTLMAELSCLALSFRCNTADS